MRSRPQMKKSHGSVKKFPIPCKKRHSYVGSNSYTTLKNTTDHLMDVVSLATTATSASLSRRVNRFSRGKILTNSPTIWIASDKQGGSVNRYNRDFVIPLGNDERCH